MHYSCKRKLCKNFNSCLKRGKIRNKLSIGYSLDNNKHIIILYNTFFFPNQLKFTLVIISKYRQCIIENKYTSKYLGVEVY